ncbi:1-aminocyclopropane-1-carboxylate synthase 1 [Lanmaoa asiatica]|nr:1-aminocyclopropane-1-carboxylate synthase 1 [Lanmaoa asiatica]
MTVAVPNGDRSNLISYSSRLLESRALVQDVWSLFNAVNLPPDCINLGQGYMNFPPPPWIIESADRALRETSANHYAHPKGRIRLRKAIKSFYEASFHRSLDVETEILVTSGANEGQYSVFTAFVEQGDEVIMFEPFFDQWLPSVIFNGGKPVYVPFHPNLAGEKPNSSDWTIDFDELRRAITPRTKMIIINTPHNPIGKVLSREELEKIAAIAEEFNLLVLSDEVYDCLVFDGKEHIRFATLPGMWDRTITSLSAGKAFAATGWRVGWLIGPESLIKPTLAACTRIVYSSNSPLQEAAAYGLEEAHSHGFFEKQVAEYQERRDVLLSAFDRVGLKYSLPEGAYFVLVVRMTKRKSRRPPFDLIALQDMSKVKFPEDYSFPEFVRSRGKDFRDCWFMATEIGVSSIPVSVFYCEEHRGMGESFARFSFCKDCRHAQAGWGTAPGLGQVYFLDDETAGLTAIR